VGKEAEAGEIVHQPPVAQDGKEKEERRSKFNINATKGNQAPPPFLAQLA
jgi:hypothetical protein